jgi:hypothetical protein
MHGFLVTQFVDNVASAAAPTPTSVAESADFDGVDDTKWLQIASTDAGLNGGDWSLSCFVRPTFIGEIGTLRGIASKGNLDLGILTTSFALYYSNITNKVVCLVSDGLSLFSVSSSVALTNNAWAFIDVHYNDTTHVLSMSINRAAAATASSVNAPNEITNELRVGSVKGTGYSAWKGQISLLGFYGSELSASNLNTVYNSGAGKLYSALSAGIKATAEHYWQLDELSGGGSAKARVDSGIVPTNLDDPNFVPSDTLVPS